MKVTVEPSRGTLYVVSAPSGTGKTTLTHRLLEETEGLEFSVSYTTRPRRAGEVDGKEYHFLDDGRFDRMLREGAFLEWATVFDRRYGTGKEATDEVLDQGLDLLLDIDVQGARQIRESAFEAVSVFILPPDFGTLKERLRSRASDDDKQVARRLAQAREEAAEFHLYDYVVVNDELERAVGQLVAIVTSERRRAEKCRKEAADIVSTFPRLGE